MFGKKKNVAPAGRQRPFGSAERPNAAVFSYHSASRNAARPSAGNVGRDTNAQQRAASGAAAERRAGSRGRFGRWPATVAAGVLLLVLLSSLYLSTTPRLEQGGDASGAIFLRDPKVYEAAAAQLLGASPLNHFKPATDTQRVADKLMAQYPELSAVLVRLPVFGHQPVLHIEPVTPALIMTGGDGQAYILDTTGRALVSPSQAPGVAKLGLPAVTDQSGIAIHAGEQALPSTSTFFITEVAGQLKAADISVNSLTLPKGTSELDVRIAGQPYFVKFNLMDNAREESGSFLAVKQRLERDHKTPGEYIDVRVQGRAYYK